MIFGKGTSGNGVERARAVFLLNESEIESLSRRPLLADPIEHFDGHIVPCGDREASCHKNGAGFVLGK